MHLVPFQNTLKTDLSPQIPNKLLISSACIESSHEIIIVVNAFGANESLWSPLCEAIQDIARLAVLNMRLLPGFEADQGCNMLVSEDAHIEDIARFIDSVGDDRAVILMGWCTGAELALRFAARVPERVKACILLNGAFKLDTDEPATAYTLNIERLIDRVLQYPSSANAFVQFFNANFHRQSSALGLPSVEVLRSVSLPFQSGDNLLRYARLISDFKQWPLQKLSDIPIPVLVLSGSCDVVANPVLSKHVAATLPSGKFHLVVGGTHYMSYDNEEVWKLIRDFLSEVNLTNSSPKLSNNL